MSTSGREVLPGDPQLVCAMFSALSWMVVRGIYYSLNLVMCKIDDHNFTNRRGRKKKKVCLDQILLWDSGMTNQLKMMPKSPHLPWSNGESQ